MSRAESAFLQMWWPGNVGRLISLAKLDAAWLPSSVSAWLMRWLMAGAMLCLSLSTAHTACATVMVMVPCGVAFAVVGSGWWGSSGALPGCGRVWVTKVLGRHSRVGVTVQRGHVR